MFNLDDSIAFYCGGRGRGGHIVAFCDVVKLNRKTVVLQEKKNSYSPGQRWICNREWLQENLAKQWNNYGYNANFKGI